MPDHKQALGPIRNLFSGSDQTLRQIAKGAADLRPFRHAWHKLLSSEPARDHIRPAFFIDGKLTVWVDSPVWGNWIRHRRDSLLAGIEKQELPKVHTLIVRLSPESYGENHGSREIPDRKQPSKDTQQIISQTAKNLADPDLSESLQRLAKTLRSPR